MRTFFIYDTTYCRADEDDPKDAILYFFPVQASVNQSYSLCCQIAGVAKFLKSTFSCPSIIALDQDKFALHWSGKYLFVLGGRENTHENILKQELLFLCGIFCFYHGSVNNLLKACKNDRKEFLDQMELAMSRYISLSQCFKNLLNLPVIPIPMSFGKKNSERVSKANELLHMCQLSASVIAGAVYCNNRLLASQLIPELTSYLTLMSNKNASFPVANVITPIKNLPPNVELKYVYLSKKTIQSIVKHNHKHVGSCVRVKTGEKKKSLPLSCSGNVTSGSEGDVDSGHCTETAYQRQKSSASIGVSKNQTSYSEFDFKKQLLCCSVHAEIFKKDLLKCRNKIFKKYLNLDFITEKVKHFEKRKNFHLNMKPSSMKSTAKVKSALENKIFSCNLLCHYHADMFSSNFLFASTYDHQNFSSTCDLEYSCYFCINHCFSSKFMSLSLKRWNSEMNIPDYLYHIPLKPHLLEYASPSDKLRNVKSSMQKIQILKCRTRSNANTQCTKKSSEIHSKKYRSEHTIHSPKSRNSKHTECHSTKYMFNSKDYWENMENNDLEKFHLYVQRFESNMVVILLNKNYDENVLTYLWNCSFTFLKELEYPEEKIKENKVDSMHYILIYDSAKKNLQELTHNDTSVFTEKTTRDSIQSIQEDFNSNPKLNMFSLLSANRNIFAYQKKHHCAFYLHQDLSSKKSETLPSLSKRAAYRLEKYMNLFT